MPDILSVGIDIGTTTTQLVFSSISIENTAGYFTVPKVNIVDKKVLYRSQVHPTPLTTRTMLDTEKIRDIISSEYRQSGFRPEDTATGAVIITGESAIKENAKAALEQLSTFAGDFVVSTAGPDLESIIAGKGSGAWQYSQEKECRVVNLDIGGGTTNIVWFDHGETVATCCLNIGGHLILIDKSNRIVSISSPAKQIADELDIPLSVGKQAIISDISRITDKMAEMLEELILSERRTNLMNNLLTAGSSDIPNPLPVRKVCISGGVAECMKHSYSRENVFHYGDIGILLAQSILKRNALTNGSILISSPEPIRATVIGAGTYTTTLSGSTIFCSDGTLPLKNLPVCKLSLREQEECISGNSDILKLKWRNSINQNAVSSVLLVFPGLSNPTYLEIKSLASVIYRTAEDILPDKSPLLVLTEQDMAKALALSIQSLSHGNRKLICIDSIYVSEHDFVDIGKPLMGGLVVPVVIKTLLFG